MSRQPLYLRIIRATGQNRLEAPLLEVGALSHQSRKIALLGLLAIAAALFAASGCSVGVTAGRAKAPEYNSVLEEFRGTTMVCPHAYDKSTCYPIEGI